MFTEFRTFFHLSTFRMWYGISENSSELYGIQCRRIPFSYAEFRKTYENVRFLLY
jgi:hypothetical protein